MAFEDEKLTHRSVSRLNEPSLPLKRIPQMSFSTSESQNPIGYSNDEIDQLLEAVLSQPPPSRSPAPPLNILQPITTSSPEIKECGWTSPPRAIVVSSTRLSNKTTLIPRDLNCQSRLIDTDIKPMQNLSNNSFQFVEDYQIEFEQMKDEYRRKFHRDQTRIEDEINRLIDHERMTFGQIKRSNSDHKRRH